MSITDVDVMRAHPDLPALEVLLDPDRLADVAPGLRLERLRLKPGASVTAILRPATGPWVLARGFAPEPWATKAGKDVHAAAKRGLPHWELPAERLVLAAAASDRCLRRLARLQPDTGRPVPRFGVVRTLSHNPARRWVGLAESHGTRRVLRVHSDRRTEKLPWVPGRTWQPGDPLPAPRPVGAGADQVPDLVAALAAAVAGLRQLHQPWAGRAAAVVAASADRLGTVPRVPQHGDLTPDQVIVHGDATTVVDWDRAGRWPAGWDAATWTAGLIVAGWYAPGGSAVAHVRVDPAVLAAAAVLRAPEPFRRRHPHWAERTEALLDHAEGVLA